MSLVYVVLILVAAAVLMYYLPRWFPMDATIWRIIRIVVIVAIVLWLLQLFGILPDLTAIKVGK